MDERTDRAKTLPVSTAKTACESIGEYACWRYSLARLLNAGYKVIGVDQDLMIGARDTIEMFERDMSQPDPPTASDIALFESFLLGDRPDRPYSYSTDEELFTGRFDTREAAIKEATGQVGDIPSDASGCEYVWTGKVVPATSYLRKLTDALGAAAIEQMEDWLAEHIAADDPIIECTKEQERELNTLIVEWAVKNLNFTFHGIEEIEMHEVPEEQE